MFFFFAGCGRIDKVGGISLYLKRIELHGFKSFADRIILELQPGINAIVGPNGSGKSNIIDAIRWVLGEQSVRSLRGAKLEDVIFSGSDKKRPMGMAEVALTIDNSEHLIPLEYSEISFIRRAFRSGESEFYLNRTPCRLKDIQDLLIDSGVGKDGYSIIGQGRIDEILTCKPEERRVIFEEAAGIMKYRGRKKEAEKRLEETVDNISRVDDVIYEISSQLEPLALQKETALKYKVLTSEFMELDVNILLIDLQGKEKRLNQIEENKQENERLLEELNKLKQSAKEQIVEYETKLGSNEEEYERIQRTFYTINSQRKDMEKDLELAINEKKRIKNEQEQLIKDIEQKEERIITEQNALRLKSNNLEEKIKTINRIELEVDENEKRLTLLDDEINRKEKYIESIKGDVIDLLNYASEKRNAISGLNTMKLNLQKRLQQITNEEQQINEVNSKTSHEIADIETQTNQLESLCKERETKIEETKKNLERKVLELQNKEKILIRKQQELNTLVSRRNALKEIIDSYEGYQFGVKNLLISLKDKKYIDSEIYGTIADIITVKQQYEVAIETALGGAMQNVICENEQNAKNAIDYLKKYDYGRVTFLPLSTVKPRYLRHDEVYLSSMKGYISTAIELIDYDKKFFPVLAYLLGRVIVAKSIDDAIAIANKCGFSFKIVTIEGDIINPGGSITGGSYKQSNFLLSRKRQLVDYELAIEKHKNELAEMKNLIEILNIEIERMQKSIKDNTDIIYATKSELIALKKQLEEKHRILNERCQRKNQLLEEKGQIESELNGIISQVSALETDIGSIDTKSISNQAKVKELQQQIDEDKKKRNKLTNDITNLKIDLASHKQEEISYKQSLQTIEENIKLQVREIEALKEKLKINKSLTINTEDKIAKYESEIVDFKNKEKGYDALIELLKNDKTEFKNAIHTAQFNLSKIERDINRIEKKLHDRNIQEATIKIEINQIKNELYTNYRLTDSQALEMKKELGTLEEMRKKLADIKREVESLGPVNMQAIEDYDKLKKRYDFLNTQRNDLITAKDNLDNIIEQITKTMEELLLSSIKKVNEEFNIVFSELFEGGKAELIIEENGSILNCGIEINAQPPGKKLQKLSLLSGGERALTAIALLFSILNTKATPFCVLDEIEAALDDANIERFTKYLKKVSEHTQFIIITHRKSTMGVADALYGISMEETAVSKVLAVKMEE